MTVMMVDHFTWSMEVGTTEIATLVQGTQWVVGDRADFEFRIVGDYDCYATFDDDAGAGTSGGDTNPNTNTPAPPSPVSPAPTAPSGGGGGSTDCSITSNWGSMRIQPWWGSSASSMFAMISNAPTTITSFEIKGANQGDAAYQNCVYQNTNAFQCSIAGGALTEPASVRLNGGVFEGVHIIESMTGTGDQYPLSSCSSAAFTAGDANGDDDESGHGLNGVGLVAVIICILICVAAAVGFAVWRWRAQRVNGKAYFKETADEEVDQQQMVVGMGSTEDMEMTVEVEVNEKETITTTQD